MATIAEALAIAIQHHQAGHLAEAERIYRQILALDPNHADALHLVGLLAHQLGHQDVAIEYASRAIRVDGRQGAFYCTLGLACGALGNASEAIGWFERAIDVDPRCAQAYNILGNARKEQGRLADAIACYQRAVEVSPGFVEAYNSLGIAWSEQGNREEAIACFRRAVALRPDYVNGYRNLATACLLQGNRNEAIACFQRVVQLQPDCFEAYNSLGIAWAEEGNLEEAISCYRRALELKGDLVEAHNNLGTAYAMQGDLEAAIASYRRALELKPGYAKAHSNLGDALTKQGKLAEAIACCRRALDIQADLPDAHVNLGVACFEQGNLDGAVACYQRAIQISPEMAQAHWNLCLVWLLEGDFARGWPEHEWRWRIKDCGGPRQFSQPWWDGHPLHGQTILLYAEQGLGDTIQFIRYAKLVKQQGARVVVECQEALVPLLTTCEGIDEIVPRGTELPRFDVHCPLASLPRVFETRLETIPVSAAYLAADPALVASWRKRLERFEGFRVGITWQGNPQFRKDRLRSIPLAEFAPLAEVPGVSLVSLQKGFGAEQLAALAGRFPVAEAGEFDEYSAMDRAAILTNLDLIITSDTAMAHLAGALGVPVWVALPLVPDWRWLLDREDSPWYATMRLFRQKSRGDWGGVFQRMKEALGERVEEAGRTV